MTVLYALHEPSPRHLESVKWTMRRLGSPRIRAYWRRCAWWALEGSHRIAAAEELDLIPKIIPVTLSTEFDHDTQDVMSRKVSSLLKYYDELQCWVRYEFSDLTKPQSKHENQRTNCRTRNNQV